MTKSPFKMLTLAAAGACLLAVSAPLASAQNAGGAAPVSIVPISAQLDSGSGPITAVPISAELPNAQSVAIAKKLLELDYPADLMNVKAEIPVVSGMADAKYQEELNKTIESRVLADLESMKQPAADDKASAEQDDYPFRQHELNVSYEVKSDGNDGVLSILVSTYVYTGGAHGMTRVDSYNVRTEAEASALTLEQALGQGGLGKANQAVRQQLQADPDTYYPDAMKQFQGVARDQAFFVEKGVVNLVFQQYDIAPYASGVNYVAITDDVKGPSVKLQAIDRNGKLLLPLRQAAETLGFKVAWDGKSHSAEVSRDAQWTSVTVDKNSYFVNRMAPIQLDAAPMIFKGTLYVPIGFFDQILKLDVATSASGSVTVTG